MGKYSLHKEYLKVGAFRWWFVPLVYVVVSVWMVALPMLIDFLGAGFLEGAWLAVLQFAGYAALTIGIVWLFQKHDVRSDLGLVFDSVKTLLLVVLALFVVLEFSIFLFEHFSAAGADAGKKVLSSLGFGQSSFNDMLIVFGVAVMAPIGEEFVYRGLMFKSLRDSLTRWLPLRYTFLMCNIGFCRIICQQSRQPRPNGATGHVVFYGRAICFVV